MEKKIIMFYVWCFDFEIDFFLDFDIDEEIDVLL